MASIKPAEPSAQNKRRQRVREAHFPGEHAWNAEPEKGWFKAPRTLPLIMALLRDKQISGSKDPGAVYLELFARHMSAGIVEMGSPEEHAFHAGYRGARATRTWSERMRILKDKGFIKCVPKGNLDYGIVLLVHPTLVVEQIKKKRSIPERWLTTYVQRQIEVGETRPALSKT